MATPLHSLLFHVREEAGQQEGDDVARESRFDPCHLSIHPTTFCESEKGRGRVEHDAVVEGAGGGGPILIRHGESPHDGIGEGEGASILCVTLGTQLSQQLGCTRGEGVQMGFRIK